MKMLKTAAAAAMGAATALGAGVLVATAPAQAIPDGTYWCWAHLVPNSQECPEVAPWGSRWVPCPSDALYFVLDDPSKCVGNIRMGYSTFNCWGREMQLGKICPPAAPKDWEWKFCPGPGAPVPQTWTLDGICPLS
ncbi:hypothetical protein ABQE69_12785 [Mycolicibacillus trivialis]|uniref:Secreted protein n=1 Tax=Mycolicibacillus trivialis TaxID=1798 RepID=A0A1X2EN50_9MYCO|nr:hypothetical protein [Mycolicibacillus trivialis]ORX06985.1 hypothetical protein AWC30_05335 [Mycolicibacillus trivialis]